LATKWPRNGTNGERSIKKIRRTHGKNARGSRKVQRLTAKNAQFTASHKEIAIFHNTNEGDPFQFLNSS
jgi:hypothetical protein